MKKDYIIPEDLYYTKEHTWVKIDDKLAVIGITDYGQDQLGTVVYVELPQKGDFVDAGEKVASIESLKATVDIFSPLTGKITNINDELNNEPDLINSEPYTSGWLYEIEMKDPSEIEDLLTAEDYKKYLEELEDEDTEEEEEEE
ncbi:MAG: glycine cleavage system protein GcvH [Persephonella sp.]|nr:MAG: glycine cleavage system protein GcvH [Persephonella sp.]